MDFFEVLKHPIDLVQNDPKLPDDSREVPKLIGVVGGSDPDHKNPLSI